MSDSKIVPREFVSDFALVAEHYGLKDREYEQAKQAARKDIENAIICFAELAKNIKSSTLNK